MPSTQLRLLLVILAVFLCAAPAMAGPAYRVAAPSNPQEDNWLRREGFSITFQVDEARCKKEYGADWSRQCASAPAGEEGRVVEGVRMTPPVAGVWRWIDDSTMEFTPKEHLAPDTRYAISLEKMSLPGRFSLKRQALYAAQPQAVRVGKETFWIDPSPKGAHAVSVPLRFLWPVAAQDMDGRIILGPSDPKSGLALGAPRLVWNERRDEVVVTAPVTALPENNAAARITIKGLPAFTEATGKCVVAALKKDAKTPQNVEALFSITGRARLMDVVKITVSPVYDDKLDKKFQLEVKTTLRVLPSELLRKLELIQLPRKLTAEAGKDTDWTKMPAISPEDVKKRHTPQARTHAGRRRTRRPALAAHSCRGRARPAGSRGQGAALYRRAGNGTGSPLCHDCTLAGHRGGLFATRQRADPERPEKTGYLRHGPHCCDLAGRAHPRSFSCPCGKRLGL